LCGGSWGRHSERYKEWLMSYNYIGKRESLQEVTRSVKEIRQKIRSGWLCTIGAEENTNESGQRLIHVSFVVEEPIAQKGYIVK